MAGLFLLYVLVLVIVLVLVLVLVIVLVIVIVIVIVIGSRSSRRGAESAEAILNADERGSERIHTDGSRS
jgi:uncharacterized membrane protein